MQKYAFVGLIFSILLNAASNVPVTNRTDHVIKVLILYLPASEIGKVAGNALAEIFTGDKKDKIEVLEERFGKQFYGFEGDFGKENRKYYKSLILKPNESQSLSFKNNDCVRKIKAWIVEEKTTNAVYKPTLGNDASWHAITNNRDKNDCDPKIEVTQANNKLTVKASKK